MKRVYTNPPNSTSFKRILFIFLLFALHFSFFAQQTPEEQRAYDSLETLYHKTTNDTLKIYYKYKQQQYYEQYDPEKAIRSAFKFFSVAKRANHPMSMIRCYEMIYRGYIKTCDLAATPEEKEKALGEADKNIQESIKYAFDNMQGRQALDAAFTAAKVYRDFFYRTPKRSEFYLHREINGYKEVLKRFDRNSDPEFYIDILEHMAVTFQNKNRAKEAAIYYTRAAGFCDTIKDYDKASSFYNNLGSTYMADGNYLKAQEFYFRSLQVINSLPKDSIDNNKARLVSIANTYSNISNVFIQYRNFSNAIDYLHKAVPLAQKAGMSDVEMNLINKIAEMHFRAGNTDSASVYVQKSLHALNTISNSEHKKEVQLGANRVKSNILSAQGKHDEAIKLAEKNSAIAQTHPDPIHLNYCLDVQGKVLFNAGQFKGAIDAYKQQFPVINQLNFSLETFRAKCYLNIGNAYLKMSQVDSALANLARGKHQAELVNIKYEMSQIYQSMADGYTKKGKLNDAIIYLNKFVQYKDSFLGEQVNQQVSVISSQFESNLKRIEEKARLEKEMLETQQVEERHSAQRKLLGSIIIAVSLLGGIMVFAFMRKKKDNKMLQAQKTEIEEQKVILEVKNKEILDSINYAKRIQNALFSSKDFLNQYLKENFILFKPKDIVSGDFYWTTERDNYFYLAVCDSTGHGVPGAFMSLLNGSYLSEAINEKNILAPNEVFNYVRKRLVESMSSSGNRDGMDGVLVRFDKTKKEITYAAAQNPLVLVRNNEIMELKADKMPVGLGEVMNDFTLNKLEYKEGDMLYIFTDGYADQFGGPKGKKFKYSSLYKLFSELYSNPVINISEHLEKTFEEWKGGLEQIDDVCVVGIKL